MSKSIVLPPTRLTTFEDIKALADRESNLELTRETIVEAFDLGHIDAATAIEWAGRVGVSLNVSGS